MEIDELKKIIQEEIEKELKEAYMDKDIPVVATILKSIVMAETKPRGPLRRVSIYVRDGILYLGEQIKKSKAIDINSEEFKQLLTGRNIAALSDILVGYLGMENLFVNDFISSLKKIAPKEPPENTDNISTIIPPTNQDTTKK